MSTGYAGFFVIILAIPGAILYFIYQRKQWFQKNGILATGTVVELAEDDDNESSYLYPVVRFSTTQQAWVVARYDSGQYPTAYYVGQSVQLLYDPKNPKKFIIGVEPFGVMDWFPFAVILAVILYGIYVNLE